MLQFAGMAAILNEINPGLGDKISSAVNAKFTEPIAKSYKYGWFNGFGTGLLGGILITIAIYKIRQRKNNNLKVDQ